MNFTLIADYLWGKQARLTYLLIAAAFLLFTLLGAHEIWTQEHRWADIVSGMFYRHDFLHPYLGENQYYDKPLLSYWLMAAIAMLSGTLSTWALRLPSAFAGLLAIFAIYRLGIELKNRQFGLLSGWLLLTTFYFLFWARVSSADMLNLAGSLFAVAWYFTKKARADFGAYAIFFIIIALTSLCKGLVGFIVPCIAVGTDLVLHRSFKQHLRWPLFFGALVGLLVYLLPFWASSHFGGQAYGENGLYLVYRENILRYLKPFDHEGPIYTYFIYLPIYLLPWTVFFVPALLTLKSRWHTLSLPSKWLAWTVFLLFLFFTLSGSRRSYYVLPIVPFAILFTADWLLQASVYAKRCLWSAGVVVLAFLLLFVSVDILPAWYYAQYGVNRFAVLLKQEATKMQPWNSWNIVMLDAESKLNFYLQLPPTAKHYGIHGVRRDQTADSLLQSWPLLQDKPKNTIFISRKRYAEFLKGYFIGYRMIELPAQSGLPFLNEHNINSPIAFIPASAL